jgi:hypothetical protein
MKLDKDKLFNEVEGHADRMKGPLWSKDSGEPDEDWSSSLRKDPPPSAEPASRAPTYDRPTRPSPPPRAPIDERPPRPSPPPRAPSPDVPTEEILPRLEALDHAVEKLAVAVSRRPVGSEGFPGWLEGAAGDPQAYSGPDGGRTGVYARILPTTYNQLQRVQRRMRLKTVAAAWEFLLRLGLAAADRLPMR